MEIYLLTSNEGKLKAAKSTFNPFARTVLASL